MNPDERHRNISEWAKQVACWQELTKVQTDWDREWLGELISASEEREIKSAGLKDQDVLNGIEAQTMVVEAGVDFWKNVLSWCVREGEASDKERGILQAAVSMSATRLPSARQSIVLINLVERLRKVGCPYRLRKARRSRRRVNR